MVWTCPWYEEDWVFKGLGVEGSRQAGEGLGTVPQTIMTKVVKITMRPTSIQTIWFTTLRPFEIQDIPELGL